MADVKTNEELLFAPPPVQTQFIDHYYREVQPIGNDYDSTTISFKIANITPNTFIDCSGTQLWVDVEYKNAGNNKFTAATTNQGTVNNLFHSLWSDIDVRLNHTTVGKDDHLYPYKAILHQMITWNQYDRDTHGKLVGYEVDDTPGNMNNTAATAATTPAAVTISEAQMKAQNAVTIPAPTSAAETPLYTRNRKFLTHDLAGSTKWRFIGGLYAPPMDTDFIMPPQIDVQLDLKRADPKKTVMAATGVSATDLFLPKIVNMRLKVKYVQVTPETYQAKLEEMASRGLSIPLPRYHLTTYNILAQTTHSIPVFRNQKLPSKVFMTFVDSRGYDGTQNYNPFNFQHMNLQSFEIAVGAKRYPNNRPLLDFTEQNTLTEVYYDLLGAIGARKLDGLGTLMTLEKFQKGSTLIGIDLTAGMDEGEKVTHMTETADMDISLTFSQNPDNCKMILMCYYSDGAIVLDKNMNVSTSWFN